MALLERRLDPAQLAQRRRAAEEEGRQAGSREGEFRSSRGGSDLRPCLESVFNGCQAAWPAPELQCRRLERGLSRILPDLPQACQWLCLAGPRNLVFSAKSYAGFGAAPSLVRASDKVPSATLLAAAVRPAGLS